MPNDLGAIPWSAEFTDADVETFHRTLLHPASAHRFPQIEADFRRTDPAFRPAMFGSVAAGDHADEAAVVRALRVPLAILHGEGEQVASGDYLDRLVAPTLWRGAVQRIAGAGHSPHLEQPAAFAQLVAAFAADLA